MDIIELQKDSFDFTEESIVLDGVCSINRFVELTKFISTNKFKSKYFVSKIDYFPFNQKIRMTVVKNLQN